jgi:predicted small lipoprotein YifL
MRRQLAIALTCAALSGCGQQPPPPASKREPADARAKVLADAFLSAWFDRNPDQATY